MGKTKNQAALEERQDNVDCSCFQDLVCEGVVLNNKQAIVSLLTLYGFPSHSARSCLFCSTTVAYASDDVVDSAEDVADALADELARPRKKLTEGRFAGGAVAVLVALVFGVVLL